VGIVSAPRARYAAGAASPCCRAPPLAVVCACSLQVESRCTRPSPRRRPRQGAPPAASSRADLANPSPRPRPPNASLKLLLARLPLARADRGVDAAANTGREGQAMRSAPRACGTPAAETRACVGQAPRRATRTLAVHTRPAPPARHHQQANCCPPAPALRTRRTPRPPRPAPSAPMALSPPASRPRSAHQALRRSADPCHNGRPPPRPSPQSLSGPLAARQPPRPGPTDFEGGMQRHAMGDRFKRQLSRTVGNYCATGSWHRSLSVI
jgi:hypothetical protein